jgi:acyl-CoA hydrolase
MQSKLATAQAQGRFRHLPLSYSGFARSLQEVRLDVCVATISEPDSQGLCSLGVAAEFTPRTLASARRRLAVVNVNMPAVAGAERAPFAQFDEWIESATPLKTYAAGAPTAETLAMAENVAQLIGNGAALQIGLGKAPDAVMAALRDRRWRLHSGMLSDSVIALAEGGSLDPDWPHMCCVLLGSAHLYRWASTQNVICVRGCEVTHDPARLGAISGLTTVNAAMTADLFGQCDLETANGRVVSGAGGAPDFARAARHARGGLSVVVLPSFYSGAGASVSRIVPRLGAGNIVSLPRTDADVVVTEHGAADLRGRSVHERAEALIDVAAPAHRNDLTAAWREIRTKI